MALCQMGGNDSGVLFEKLKAQVPESSLSTDTRYPIIADVGMWSEWDYDESTGLRYVGSYLYYEVYVKSKSGAVFVLSSDGIVRNLLDETEKDDIIEYYNQEISEILEYVEWDYVVMKASDPVAKCFELYGQYGDTEEDCTEWVNEYREWQTILNSSDPVASCLAYVNNEDNDWGYSAGDCESELNYMLEWNSEKAAMYNQLLVYRKALDSAKDGFDDGWEVNVLNYDYGYDTGGLTNGLKYRVKVSAPERFTYSSGFYIFDTQISDWAYAGYTSQ